MDTRSERSGIAGMSMGAHSQGKDVLQNASAAFRLEYRPSHCSPKEERTRSLGREYLTEAGVYMVSSLRGDTRQGADGIVGTILLVDKDDTLRSLEKIVISSKGYNVLTAKDGVEAIRIFSRHHTQIRLVFSEVRLPNIGAEDLLRNLRRIEPDVRVLFAGSYLNPELTSQLLRAGAVGCIQKPQTSDGIIARIGDILGK